MANVKDMFYHGIRHQVRRVVQALGEERTDKGLTAFEDGHSNWSDCFFARALAPEVNLNREGEVGVAKALGLLSSNGEPNLVPVRIVYRTFDGISTQISRNEMKQLLTDIRDETRPDGVMQLLRSIDYTNAESTPLTFAGASCATEAY